MIEPLYLIVAALVGALLAWIVTDARTRTLVHSLRRENRTLLRTLESERTSHTYYKTRLHELQVNADGLLELERRLQRDIGELSQLALVRRQAD